MFDFMIDDCGDLVKNKEELDIKRAQNGELIRQLALVRIKSVAKDWFCHEFIGANLEELYGDVVSSKLISEIEERIVYSISDIIHNDNVYILSKVNGTSIKSKVFLRINDKNTLMIEVDIDIVGGVNKIYEINT